MRIIWNYENKYSYVSPIVSGSSNIVAARLKGEFRPIGGIGASCTLRQLVYSMLPLLLYEAVLSKIPLQLLHLKATRIDCCPLPG